MSVTLVHPDKAVGGNDIPFGRDTGHTEAHVPTREGEIWGQDPPLRSDAAYRRITLVLVIISRRYR